MKDFNVWHLIAILSLIAMVLVGIFAYRMGVNSITITETVKIDTVVTRDTLTFEKPVPKYITQVRTIRDTLITTDTIPQLVEVEVPIESKTYSDSDYYAVISGYKANLDTIKVFPLTQTITVDKTIVKERKPKIAVSANVGVGYGFINKKPDVFAGISIGFPIWSK